jgi:hypothetical protein
VSGGLAPFTSSLLPVLRSFLLPDQSPFGWRDDVWREWRDGERWRRELKTISARLLSEIDCLGDVLGVIALQYRTTHLFHNHRAYLVQAAELIQQHVFGAWQGGTRQAQNFEKSWSAEPKAGWWTRPLVCGARALHSQAMHEPMCHAPVHTKIESVTRTSNAQHPTQQQINQDWVANAHSLENGGDWTIP